MNFIKNKSIFGKVEVGGKIIDVNYYFVSEDTIRCLSLEGEDFYTHYKSLVCNKIAVL